MDAWLSTVIAIAAMFCLYFFILDKRVIKMSCNHCHKTILTNTPWLCGVCGGKNCETDEFSFLNHCMHCKGKPKAYRCHHCGELIFLSEDEQKENYAESLRAPAPVRKNEKETEAAKLAGDIEVKKLKVVDADLDLKLNEYKKKLEPEKGTSIEDKYRNLLRNEDDAQRLRKAIDEEFKGDDYERERRHRIVDALMRRSL
jgi:hypothetical protein